MCKIPVTDKATAMVIEVLHPAPRRQECQSGSRSGGRHSVARPPTSAIVHPALLRGVDPQRGRGDCQATYEWWALGRPMIYCRTCAAPYVWYLQLHLKGDPARAARWRGLAHGGGQANLWMASSLSSVTTGTRTTSTSDMKRGGYTSMPPSAMPRRPRRPVLHEPTVFHVLPRWHGTARSDAGPPAFRRDWATISAEDACPHGPWHTPPSVHDAHHDARRLSFRGPAEIGEKSSAAFYGIHFLVCPTMPSAECRLSLNADPLRWSEHGRRLVVSPQPAT